MSIRLMVVLDLQEPNDRDALLRVPGYLKLLIASFQGNAEKLAVFSEDAENRMLVPAGFQIIEPEPEEGVTAWLMAYVKHIEAETFGRMPTME